MKGIMSSSLRASQNFQVICSTDMSLAGDGASEQVCYSHVYRENNLSRANTYTVSKSNLGHIQVV